MKNKYHVKDIKAMCFNKRNKETYIDPEREIYRRLFNIQDDYLIEYDYELINNEAIGFIVYIDPENDIDWKDTRDKSKWSEEDRKLWSEAIARLDNAHAEYVGHLSKKTIRAFKLRLGAGYVLAMERDFDAIDEVIGNALSFLRKRNAENARMWFLIPSTFLLILSLIVFHIVISNNENTIQLEWAYVVEYGFIGAYVSIWSRYGKLVLTGLSSICLHILEVTTRMLVGALSASVLMLAFKANYIFSDSHELIPFINGILGFAAGFSERVVPSLMEKISDNIK